MPKYTDNIKAYEKMLKKVHGGLSIASSESVNEAAEIVDAAYKKELQGFKLRNKFTMGAVKKYLSKPSTSKGDFRKIENINAKVGVLKMKGGKEHYLKKQEEGGIKTGSLKTAGKVAMAMDAARIGDKRSGVVKGALQLQRSAKVQALTFNDGKHIGTMRDGFGMNQRWAILYKHTGLSGRGAKYADNRYGWDLKKPFFFVGLVRGLGIFNAPSNRIKMIRSLRDSSVKIKRTGKFEKSFSLVDKNKLAELMQKNAKRISGVR